jgi:hypothetical protein
LNNNNNLLMREQMADIPIRQFAGLIFALCIYLYTSGGSAEETHLHVGHVYTLLTVLLAGTILWQSGLTLRLGNIRGHKQKRLTNIVLDIYRPLF